MDAWPTMTFVTPRFTPFAPLKTLNQLSDYYSMSFDKLNSLDWPIGIPCIIKNNLKEGISN